MADTVTTTHHSEVVHTSEFDPTTGEARETHVETITHEEPTPQPVVIEIPAEATPTEALATTDREPEWLNGLKSTITDLGTQVATLQGQVTALTTPPPSPSSSPVEDPPESDEPARVVEDLPTEPVPEAIPESQRKAWYHRLF